MENQSNSPTPSAKKPTQYSPLPAWKHYEILKYTEEKIMDELRRHNQHTDSEEFLTGLAVGYIFIPEDEEVGTKFSMSFGYDVDCEDEKMVEDLPSQDPQNEALDDNFITDLYNEVRDLIVESAPANNGEYLASVALTTGHCSTLILTCAGRRCGICGRHNQKHIQKYVKVTSTSCGWVCTGTNC